jgi:hypothetical protein
MTEPPEGERPTPEQQPAAAAQATPSATPPSPPLPWAGPPQWGAPFAPVPRVPWINPQRRGQLIGAAVVAALVLLGAGFGIGYAAAPSGPDHGVRIERGVPGKLLGPYGRHPNRPFPGAPKLRPSTVPTPTPSSTSTG